MAHHLILPDLQALPVTNDFWLDSAGNPPDGIGDITKLIHHDGGVGVATGVFGTPGAFDNGAAYVQRNSALGNIAVNGPIASAAQLDAASSFSISQTTAGRTFTIPAAVTTIDGREVTFFNVGSTPFSVQTPAGTVAIPVNTGLTYRWISGDWRPVSQQPVAPAAPVDFWRSEPGTALPDGIGDTTDPIHHEGAVGIKTGVTIVPGALDVNAPFVRRRLFLFNVLPASGPIGTAAATVDITSAVVIQQPVSSGLIYTIPNPTDTTSGRRLTITNQGGNNPFQIQTDAGLTRIANGEQCEFVFDAFNSGAFNWYAPPTTPNPPDFFRTPNASGALPDGTNDVTEQIVRTGDIGIGFTGVTVPVAKLDLNGAYITRVGATVVFAPLVGVPFTTAQVDNSSYGTIIGVSNAVLTLPLPTNTATTGRWFAVVNAGTTIFTLNGITMFPGVFRHFVFSAVTATWLNESPGSSDFFRSPTLAGGDLPDGVTDLTDSIVHTGDTGFGLAGTVTPVAKVDILGAFVTRPFPSNITLAAASGPITTTANINTTSYISVQGLAGGTYTIPVPTSPVGGRYLVVSNFGITTYSVNSVSIPPSTVRKFYFDSQINAWVTDTSLPSADFFRSGGVAGALPDGVGDVTDDIYHSGDVGLGHTGAQTAAIGTVTIRNKGLVLFPGTVTNQAANFTIPAATIDVASTLLVAQTTAGIVFTLSAPTDATSQGRVLRVLNSGSAAFTILDTVINPGKFGDFVWQGAGTWSSQAGQAGNVQKFRVVQALVVGANVVAHNLALANFAAVVDVRDNATGATIAVSITAETTNSVTITVAGAVAAGRITVLG